MTESFPTDDWYFENDRAASEPTVRDFLEPLNGRQRPRLSADELSARRAAKGHRPRLVRDKGDRL